MNHCKRGRINLEMFIVIALVILFLIIAIAIFSPLATTQFQLGLKEQACRQSLPFSEGIKHYTLGVVKIQPLCSTEVIPFGEKQIMKQAKQGETAKDAAARQILEYMQRCKDTVHGPKATTFLSGKSCYICYSLKTDQTTPFLTEEELNSYSLAYRTPKNERYFIELRKYDHNIITYFGGGLGSKTPLPSSSKAISLSQQYGVVYANFDKGSLTRTLGAGVGACAAIASTWVIPFFGRLTVPVTAPVCMVSLGTSGIISLTELFQKKEDGVGAILVADYQYLEQYGCGTSATVTS